MAIGVLFLKKNLCCVYYIWRYVFTSSSCIYLSSTFVIVNLLPVTVSTLCLLSLKKFYSFAIVNHKTKMTRSSHFSCWVHSFKHWLSFSIIICLNYQSIYMLLIKRLLIIFPPISSFIKRNNFMFFLVVSGWNLPFWS